MSFSATMSNHARLRPSAAPQWGPCPGSVQMREAVPEPPETEAAKEGRSGHVLAERMIEAEARANIGYPTRDEWVGHQVEGVIITDEIYDACLMYARDIGRVMRAEGVFAPTIEQRVSMARRVHPDNWGTPDCYLWSLDRLRLYHWDLKLGWEIVEAESNLQSVDYIAGILEAEDPDSMSGFNDEAVTVVSRIVQPRPFHPLGYIREWRVQASDLRGYINYLRNSANEALGDSPRTVTGPQCKHCPARYACKAHRRSNLAAIDYAMTAVLEETPPQNLRHELQALRHAEQRLQQRISALEEQTIQRIIQGEPIPGLSLQTGKGRRQWSKPVEEVERMGRVFGVDLLKPPEPITPNQAKQKGIPDTMVKSMSETPVTGFKLIERENSWVIKAFQPKE